MLTRKRVINFKELVDIKLPKAKKTKEARNDSQLYDIEVLERDPRTQSVKIHYIGYSARHDEWRPVSDIIDKPMKQDTPHAELASRIKSSLTSSRKNSPEVRIEIPFDKGLYDSNASLKAKGKEVKIVRGVMHFSISSYSDLVPILGKNWHVRGINEVGDCCYVILETVRFYLRRRR